jgi:Iap family predicted aminopeptidase
VEVKIGVQNANRELVIDTEKSSDDIEKAVSEAVAAGDQVIVIEDSKGRKVLVPAGRLAYVEIGSPTIGQVGFRS